MVGRRSAGDVLGLISSNDDPLAVVSPDRHVATPTDSGDVEVERRAAVGTPLPAVAPRGGLARSLEDPVLLGLVVDHHGCPPSDTAAASASCHDDGPSK